MSWNAKKRERTFRKLSPGYNGTWLVSNQPRYGHAGRLGGCALKRAARAFDDVCMADEHGVLVQPQVVTPACVQCISRPGYAAVIVIPAASVCMAAGIDESACCLSGRRVLEEATSQVWPITAIATGRTVLPASSIARNEARCRLVSHRLANHDTAPQPQRWD